VLLGHPVQLHGEPKELVGPADVDRLGQEGSSPSRDSTEATGDDGSDILGPNRRMFEERRMWGSAPSSVHR
jgi:hypothetical protein